MKFRDYLPTYEIEEKIRKSKTYYKIGVATSILGMSLMMGLGIYCGANFKDEKSANGIGVFGLSALLSLSGSWGMNISRKKHEHYKKMLEEKIGFKH